MTPSELRFHVEQTGSHFFDRKALKFFGDTMKNYGCRDAGEEWELWRKKQVKHGLKGSHFFNKVTFAHRSA